MRLREQDEGAIERVEWNASRYFYAVNSACVNRKVFRTVDDYIGVGPKIARAGDVVVILHGGSKPFILRPFGGEYKILGECYVARAMEGWYAQEHRRSGKPDVIFRIR
jgi:hypothetical protein